LGNQGLHAVLLGIGTIDFWLLLIIGVSTFTISPHSGSKFAPLALSQPNRLTRGRKELGLKRAEFVYISIFFSSFNKQADWLHIPFTLAIYN
jgi:hypothetical protein